MWRALVVTLRLIDLGSARIGEIGFLSDRR
jgi:hypothetical protein